MTFEQLVAAINRWNEFFTDMKAEKLSWKMSTALSYLSMAETLLQEVANSSLEVESSLAQEFLEKIGK